ncbi:MAG: P-loop NTPase [Bacteroidales bacterium]|jgi:ATP-binding protein involved in chromosome partitioning
MKADIKTINKILASVFHPAKDENIVSLGMVEDIKIEEEKIKFKLVFTGRDALAGSIKKECEKVLNEAFPNMEISILELVREKKPEKKVKLELGQEQLSDVDKIIAIASGKGGVGKSTVAVNLAITLAKMGYKVGLADADVYGPSVPKMTGTEGFMPEVEIVEGGKSDSEKSELIIPIEKYGVKWMSIGYFARPEQALIWRGPMACNALKQMILQVKWGRLDYLLIDLPPGTGDIHISMVHDIPLSGAIIVSTPQVVALADVEKGVNMFRNDAIKKHIYGIIENMAWFTPAELPQNKYYIFGKDGCKAIADKYDLPLLGQIPLIQSIREGGDNGEPSALTEGPVLEAMKKIAGYL